MKEETNAKEESKPNDVDGENPTKKQKLSKKQRRKTRQQRYKEKFPKPDYAPIVKSNENYNKYYKMQPFFEEGEFDNEFMKTLQETLQASFRINGFEPNQAKFLRNLIEHGGYKNLLGTDESDKNGQTLNKDKPLEVPQEDKNLSTDIASTALQQLLWYPQKLAWQMNITRLDLRNNSILKQLHKFIMAETENGFISRQEAVSMIPPLLLDVHKGQSILDMCAAPGSKTAQLVEYLTFDIMSSGQNDKNTSKYPFDDGMVVANDVDNKRCYMLVHQSSRLNSPNCIIINQDACRMPNIKCISTESSKEGANNYTNLKFDRILCDVPCSGDGTMRKNPDVWKKWSVGNANNFHGMQTKILRRGLELLKENGLLVYSTCSLNPVEDEAVIASILRASEGKVVLQDVSEKVPDLKFRPGINKWTVMSKEMVPIPKPESDDVELSSHIYPSLFQPSEEESKTFNLNFCMRILPHFQNTGGFFVAVLKKLSDRLPWQEPEKDDETIAQLAINPKKRRFTGFKEDPFHFLDSNDPDWISLKDVYKIDDNFPVDQLVHRSSEGKKRTIYLVSKKVKEFVIANREESGRKDFVKIINCGMKLFHKAETKAGFRICQDGVLEILPHIKDDIKLPISKDDLVLLLRSRNVAFHKMSARDRLDKIEPGSFIMLYKFEDPTTKELHDIALVGWKGDLTVTLYVSNTYRTHLCALAQIKISEDYAVNEKKTADKPQKSKNGDQ